MGTILKTCVMFPGGAFVLPVNIAGHQRGASLTMGGLVSSLPSLESAFQVLASFSFLTRKGSSVE